MSAVNTTLRSRASQQAGGTNLRLKRTGRFVLAVVARAAADYLRAR